MVGSSVLSSSGSETGATNVCRRIIAGEGVGADPASLIGRTTAVARAGR